MLTLSGCWNYRELNRQTIVAGAALDITDEGKVKITAETVGFGNGSLPDTKSVLISGEGEGIAHAVADLMDKSGRRLYWYHASLIIVSEEYAESHMNELLDYIFNEHEMRFTLMLAVSQLETAEQVYELESMGANVKSFALASIIQEQSKLGRTVRTEAYEVINTSLENGMEFALPKILSVKVGDRELSSVSGCAVFADEKLVGYLDCGEVIVIQLFTDNLYEAEIDVPTENGHFSVSAYYWKSKVDADAHDGELSVKMSVKAKYEMLELGPDINPDDPRSPQIVNAALDEQIKTRINDVIDKLQDMESDALGIGNLIWRQNPDEFEKLGEWYDTYCEMDVEIETDLRNDSRSSSTSTVLG
jgi:spore germination protein KC